MKREQKVLGKISPSNSLIYSWMNTHRQFCEVREESGFEENSFLFSDIEAAHSEEYV